MIKKLQFKDSLAELWGHVPDHLENDDIWKLKKKFLSERENNFYIDT